MRLPVIGSISTKDGATNKNARLTNMLAEQKKNGTTLATVRPGLNTLATGSGAGNSLVCFGGNLINIYGNTVYESNDAEISWTSGVLPSTGNWVAVAGNSTTLIAILQDGSSVATSSDGVTWQHVASLSAGNWYGAAGNEAMFVAVKGFSTDAVSSPDGVTWTPRTLPVSTEWNSVVEGNGVFVAVGTSVSIASSSDGASWIERTLSNAPLGIVAWNGEKFCVLTGASFATAEVSTDGSSWVTTNGPNGSSIISMSGGDGKFYAIESVTVGAKLYISEDGDTWQYKTMPSLSPGTYWKDIIAANGVLVAIGHRTFYVSSDEGDSWELFEQANVNWKSLGYGIGRVCGTAQGLANVSASSLIGFGSKSIGTVTDNHFDFALIP